MFLSYSGFCKDMLSSKFVFAAIVLVFKNALPETMLISENENFRRKFCNGFMQSICLTHKWYSLHSFRPLQKQIGTKMYFYIWENLKGLWKTQG